MGKLKNMIIEMEEMNLTSDPLPWEMGAPLCKECSGDEAIEWLNKMTQSPFYPLEDTNSTVVPCSYCGINIETATTNEG
jgi:hypothetical protein